MANPSIALPNGTADAGIIVLDLSMRSIAWDQGAASILKDGDQAMSHAQPARWIPQEIVDIARRRKLGDLTELRTHLRIGEVEYLCRAYLLESITPALTQHLVAIHLERTSFAIETVYSCASQYHLTAREAEVLRGITMGLATKELATRLNISPNTVKAFLRLVMIKMGVATRGEMFAKLLESRGMPVERTDQAESAGGSS